MNFITISRIVIWDNIVKWKYVGFWLVFYACRIVASILFFFFLFHYKIIFVCVEEMDLYISKQKRYCE